MFGKAWAGDAAVPGSGQPVLAALSWGLPIGEGYRGVIEAGWEVDECRPCLHRGG